MVTELTENIVLSVINKSFSALGQNPKKALWYILESDYKITPQNVVGNLNLFEKVLRSIFGSAYGLLDVLLCKYLSEAVGETFNENKSFVESVKSLSFNKNYQL
jgi:hypothetical protein